MIRHVVMWKFKEGEQENMHKFLRDLKALDGVIPEIKKMEVFVSCKAGNDYDACLMADFEDIDAMLRYRDDPRHVAVASFCKTIRETRGAIDFEI